MKSIFIKNKFKTNDTMNIKSYKKDTTIDCFKDFHINGEIITTKFC